MTKPAEPTKPRGEVTFRCVPCAYTFKAEPARVEDAPAETHHPWLYFANCRYCQQECAQIAWERALLKAWTKATGPVTDEGKAATAKNLEGHPTPDEALRTRFNAMKHGLSARTATYFPAKPDGYAFCKSCTVDRDWCRRQPACAKQAETFMLHHAAFEQRKPEQLSGIYADLQAALFTVLQQILQTIIADGVKIVSPEYYTTADGKMILATYIDEKTFEPKTIMNINAHPLFKPLGELMSRIGLTLADMGMTTKVLDQHEADMGRLASEQASKEQLSEFQSKQSKALELLADRLDRGAQHTARDPVLLEFNAETGVAS